MRLTRNRQEDGPKEPGPRPQGDDPGNGTVGDAVVPDVLDQDGPDDAEGGSSRLRWILMGIAVAAVIAAVALLVVRSSDRAGSPGATPTISLAPGGRVPFQFRLTSVSATSYTGQRAPRVAARAGGFIRALVSRFYDAGFADPAEWTDGPPAEIWNSFGASTAAQARGKSGRGLTLGKVDGLDSLEVDRSRLFVRVLLDPSHRAVAAVATMSLDATGTMSNGNLLDVANDARFFLRVINGRWTVVGFPSAKTTLKERPAPAPTPAAGPSGSAPAPSAAPSSP